VVFTPFLMNYILRVNYCFIIQIKVLFVSLFLIILSTKSKKKEKVTNFYLLHITPGKSRPHSKKKIWLSRSQWTC
uniref:Uncharacterized protein n=2 Tax=Anas TaxID=8835 RepID=A0A8B9VB35_9AVES